MSGSITTRFDHDRTSRLRKSGMKGTMQQATRTARLSLRSAAGTTAVRLLSLRATQALAVQCSHEEPRRLCCPITPSAAGMTPNWNALGGRLVGAAAWREALAVRGRQQAQQRLAGVQRGRPVVGLDAGQRAPPLQRLLLDPGQLLRQRKVDRNRIRVTRRLRQCSGLSLGI